MIRCEKRDITVLKEYDRNANDHPPEQLEEIAASVLEFGYNDPITVDENDTVLTGHGTRRALLLLVERGREEFRTVDVIVAPHMSDRQKRAYILAHNRIARNSVWNFDKLSAELNDLVEMDFSIDVLGFDEQEIDSLLKLDSSILPDETPAVQPPPADDSEPKEKRTRAKSKILHTCPACKHEFTA